MSIETTRTFQEDERPAAKKIQRMFYLDNLRLLFTLLVILHHICLTYTGEKGWYYYDPINDPFSNLTMFLLMTINRNWVLQCFFLLSGYFTPGSLDRKGLWVYLKERLVHIGIPLAFYVVVIRPPVVYFTQKPHRYSFLQCIYKNIVPGPAWFLEVLLIFSVIYGVIWYIRRPGAPQDHKELPFPPNSSIFLFIFILSVVTFVIRMYLPGYMQIFYLRLGNYADYIAFFAAGIWGYRNKWLDKLSDRAGLQWTLITALAVILYGAFVIHSWASHESLSYLRGGASVKTFITTWIGTHIAVGISISFIYLFRKFLNAQPGILKIMAAEAYSVFIFHPPIVIAATYAIHCLSLQPFLKFIMGYTLSTILCFLVCRYIVRKIPFADRVV
jgi:glucans biosynthesis protein C